MDSAEKFFDEFYNVLMDKCVPNFFVKRACGLIYSFVKKEIKEYRNEHNIMEDDKFMFDKTEIKDCGKRVCKVINLFEKNDLKCEKFMEKFPKWKICREKNIKLLDEIASDLHDEKKVMNAINTITSVLGLAGGAAVLGAIFFPPASIVTIPAWLGGSTVAAFLPSCVLGVIGTTTTATSTLALTGGAACAVNGASKVLTSVTELKLLKKHIDDAKAIILEDQEYFEDFKDLLTNADIFSNALEEILNFQSLDCVLKDVYDFLDLVTKYKYKNFDVFSKELKNSFQRYISCISPLLPFEYRIALIGILFVSFLVYKKNCFLLNNIVGACQILAGNLLMLKAFGAVSITTKQTSLKIASGVAVEKIKLFTGIAMALDAVTIIQNCIDIKNGSQNEHGKKVKEISDRLKKELNVVEELYKKSQHSMLRSMFLESQNPRHSSIVIKEGSQSKQEKEVNEISDKLKKELNIRERFDKIRQRYMLHSMFLESQIPRHSSIVIKEGSQSKEEKEVNEISDKLKKKELIVRELLKKF